ncbi:MAG: ATP-binding cassette domain-containing protein [Caulobacteraceae bacterium]
MISKESRVLIWTENLSKTYLQGTVAKEAVENANIRIIQGEFVIIHGLSGKQKNVFFNLVGCLERPSSGKYMFDYEDISLAKDADLDRIRMNKIGYLFKNFNLLDSKTVAENMELPMLGKSISIREKQERMDAAAKKDRHRKLD